MSNPKDYLNRSRGQQTASTAPENLCAARQTQNWDRWEEVQRQRESRKSVQELNDDAYSAYQQHQLELAASLFAEAAELARQQGDTAAQAENLHWEGDTLWLNNHLEKALARLLQAESLNALDAIDRFRNFLRIVSIARDLPLPLPQQQELMAKLEPYKGNQQIGGSKSMVLNAESDFLYDRGMDMEALAKTQEAFASRVDRAPSYDNKIYFNGLVFYYRLTGQYAEARKILHQWRSEATYDFADEKSWLLKAEARILYSEGFPEAAWDMMQRAYAEERYIQRAGKNSGTLFWMIQIGSELGHFEQVRPLVFQMLRFRRSESLHTRFSCYHTLARYCCQVCIHGVLPAKDTARMRRHARFWLRQAEETARKLDQLLECSWRTKLIQKLREQYTSSL